MAKLDTVHAPNPADPTTPLCGAKGGYVAPSAKRLGSAPGSLPCQRCLVKLEKTGGTGPR